MEEKVGADWLFPKAEQQAIDQKEKGLIFAQRYLVFLGPTSDPRARELFEHWVEAVENQDVAPNASPQEYAYWEGRRSFIRGIQRQIKFASQGQNVPQPRTK